MCGIVGYVGERSCAPILVDGLRRLEYRGYDSAGLAVHDGMEIRVVKAVGKLCELEAALEATPLAGTTGIGHTRWATHGGVTQVNAHPHVVGDVTVIHNGIIENHSALRTRLQRDGARMLSDTDTEVFAHLVDEQVRTGKDLEGAVRAALVQVRGAYAVAVVSAKEPGHLVVAKNGSPLVLGLGDGETFCASDMPAILPNTRRMLVMEDGQLAVLTHKGARLSTLAGEPMEAEIRVVDWSPLTTEKNGYKHFMLKEIFEQPRAIEDTLRGRIDWEHGDMHGTDLGLSADDARRIERVYLVACGTSYHAAMIGRTYIERLARVPAHVELASEFRSRDPVFSKNDLVIVVSQSGETLDTLMAAKLAKEHGAQVLAISNVIDSSIPRMANGVLYTRAGPEIGVASTKCFTAQIVALLMLALFIGRRREALSVERARELIDDLAHLPTLMQEVLSGTRESVERIAKKYRAATDVLYLGRGLSFPVALEGALKLKEISYVHAEGYAAGEMKHGPIALIDDAMPVIVLVPRDDVRDKTMGNLQEAKARGGRIIAIATEGDAEARDSSEDSIEVPATSWALTPMLTNIPLQLYAYYIADLNGKDVDQPRNLAKTVTVE